VIPPEKHLSGLLAELVAKGMAEGHTRPAASDLDPMGAVVARSELELSGEGAPELTAEHMADLLSIQRSDHLMMSRTPEGDSSGAFTQSFGALAAGKPEPEVTAGIAFCVLVLIYVAKVSSVDWPQAQKKAEERLEMQHDVYKLCNGPAKKMMQNLKAIQGNTSVVHFQTKYNGFVRLLKGVAKTRALSTPDAEIMEPMREFLRQWCVSFAGCSLRPGIDPVVLCSKEKIAQATTLSELAETIAHESQGKIASHADPFVQKVLALNESIKVNQKRIMDEDARAWFSAPGRLQFDVQREDPSENWPLIVHLAFLRLTLVSPRHFQLFLGLCTGVALAALLHITSKHLLAIGVDIAVCVTMGLMSAVCSLDGGGSLDTLKQQYKKYATEVEEHTSTISTWSEKYQKVVHFWQHHTVPRLDLFEAVSAFPKTFAGHSHNWGQVADAIRDINLKLEYVVDGMGDQKDHNKHKVEHDLLPLAEQQMRRSIEAIAIAAGKGEVDDIERNLECFCDLLVVRVKRARDLPDMDKTMFSASGDVTDGYTVVRFGNGTREDCKRTKVVDDNLNPTWDETFTLTVPCGETQIVLEVYDRDDERWMGAARSKEIGYVVVPFRNRPGEWMEQVECLTSFNKKVGQLKSTIEFSYFFADCYQTMPGVSTLGAMKKRPASSVYDFLKPSRGSLTSVDEATSSSSNPHPGGLERCGSSMFV